MRREAAQYSTLPGATLLTELVDTTCCSGDTHHYTHAGVAIVINNELLNYIKEIEPINDRIMTIAFAGTLPTTFVCNYSPTAKATEEEKK